MQLLGSLASLFTTVSALDIYLHQNNNCGDSSLRCNEASPGYCCGTSSNVSPYESVTLRGIESGWNLQLTGYDGGVCTNVQTTSGNNGNPWICNRSNGFKYTGAQYAFVGSTKRGAAATGSNSACRRPNALVLADGTEYDLSGLDDDDFENLVTLSLNATSHADVPQQLQSLIIN
ncbi:hypothetical protein GGR56DRAFT_668436 [Xylariaceae sp. FL0804]|nr:hypothetical protein GGR56DRAFT_668436 [Xylariaceae sp. FL0804]